MCTEQVGVIFVISILAAFVVFVFLINWWNVVDSNKMLDRLYGDLKPN